MLPNDKLYKQYVTILEEELVPAMGCTEPISLAYAAAKAKEVLGALPERILVEASGSIIKNVKSVIVPNTNYLKGIRAAVSAGIIAGIADKELEVISSVTETQKDCIRQYLEHVEITEQFLDSSHVFDLIITLYHGEHYCKVRITDYHTNIVLIEKDHQVLFEKKTEIKTIVRTDRSILNIKDIWDFCQIVEIKDIQDILERQISFNTKIAQEGIEHPYGANIGKVILKSNPNDVKNRAKAMAAAGSDARMNGCDLPVIINSGSGNQGITCSLPVIEYAKEKNASHEQLLRALALSNLVAIHEKTGIGTLSAYCGAVSAAAGAGAGIAYICSGGYSDVVHTVSNTLAIVSGIVCDGAKASCAAKIASSVDAAILAYEMYQEGQEFKGGDGLLRSDIESTIRNIGILGRDGMKKTNESIIHLMLD